MSLRRPKWHPPPPPSPRILHFPRRIRRPKQPKPPALKTFLADGDSSRRDYRGKLETLFDEERVFSRSVPIVLFNSADSERRDRVGNADESRSEDEKWRFQAEFLRAECNFLRMEREMALKKLERNRLQTERTLQSAVDTLASGRRKMDERKDLGLLVEEEIEELEEKLQELQRSSGVGDFELRKCRNFDRQASVLRRRLERIEVASEEKRCVREIREMAEASMSIESNISCKHEKRFVTDRKIIFADVEMLRRKMEGVSKGMLERMEEYGSTLLSSSSSTASSVSTSSTRIEFPETAKRQQARYEKHLAHLHYRSSGDQCSHAHKTMHAKLVWFPWNGLQLQEVCSGQCKAIVKRIVEDVRAETEQWSEMQGMLGQVREEMEELQASRDFWEHQAYESDKKLQTLQIVMHEWRQKAISSENKANQLQKQVADLRVELQKLMKEPKEAPADVHDEETSGRRLFDLHKEKEKRVLICRLKENCHSSKRNEGKDEKRRVHRAFGTAVPKRLPLQEIGNSSQLFRQTRAVFPLHSPDEPSMSESP
ncbi:hypothetical protein ACLOJK_016089 [Asimina triloba]